MSLTKISFRKFPQRQTDVWVLPRVCMGTSACKFFRLAAKRIRLRRWKGWKFMHKHFETSKKRKANEGREVSVASVIMALFKCFSHKKVSLAVPQFFWNEHSLWKQGTEKNKKRLFFKERRNISGNLKRFYVETFSGYGKVLFWCNPF